MTSFQKDSFTARCPVRHFNVMYVCIEVLNINILAKSELTRNSPGDEIANVNFFTTSSSTTFTQCAPEATEFGEITQNKDNYAVQGHSRLPILVPIESSYSTSYL